MSTEAIDALGKVLDILKELPDDVSRLRVIASACIQLGEYERAEECLRLLKHKATVARHAERLAKRRGGKDVA